MFRYPDFLLQIFTPLIEINLNWISYSSHFVTVQWSDCGERWNVIAKSLLISNWNGRNKKLYKLECSESFMAVFFGKWKLTKRTRAEKEKFSGSVGMSIERVGMWSGEEKLRCACIGERGENSITCSRLFVYPTRDIVESEIASRELIVNKFLFLDFKAFQTFANSITETFFLSEDKKSLANEKSVDIKLSATQP